MKPDLTDEETAALVAELDHLIENDRDPLASSCCRMSPQRASTDPARSRANFSVSIPVLRRAKSGARPGFRKDHIKPLACGT
jgi:hypothetical protein